MLVLNAFPAISEGLNLKIFPRSMPPPPPLTNAKAFGVSPPPTENLLRDSEQRSPGPSPRWIAPPRERKKPDYGPALASEAWGGGE